MKMSHYLEVYEFMNKLQNSKEFYDAVIELGKLNSTRKSDEDVNQDEVLKLANLFFQKIKDINCFVGDGVYNNRDKKWDNDERWD